MRIVEYRDVATPIFPTGYEDTVRAMYANGEQGAWYDPSDMSTLFQDAAGTTPVTAVGQPVGLMLDRRFGLEKGPEMMPANPVWDLSSNPTAIVSGHRVECLQSGNVFADIGTYNGTSWVVEFDIVQKGALPAHVFFGGIVGATTVPTNTPLGRFTAIRLNTSGSRQGQFIFGGNNAGWIIDNISIREVPGFHISQEQTPSRPQLQEDSMGRRYLHFDGVDDFMMTGAYPSPRQADIFFAVNVFAPENVPQYLFDWRRVEPIGNSYVWRVFNNDGTGSSGGIEKLAGGPLNRADGVPGIAAWRNSLNGTINAITMSHDSMQRARLDLYAYFDIARRVSEQERQAAIQYLIIKSGGTV